MDFSFSGNMRKHVGVALVIGGGLEIINQVKETVENKMPLIIFKRTGFAAELLLFAYDLKPLENCNLRDLQQHQQLIELIRKTFPDLTMAKTIACYDTIMECMRYKTYVSGNYFMWYVQQCLSSGMATFLDIHFSMALGFHFFNNMFLDHFEHSR